MPLNTDLTGIKGPIDARTEDFNPNATFGDDLREVDGGDSLLDAVQDGFHGGLVNTLEYSGIEYLQTELMETNGSPLINKEQAKAEYDIDIDGDVPVIQAQVLSLMKKDKLEKAEAFGRHAFNPTKPLNFLAAWATAGFVNTFSPTSVALTAGTSAVGTAIAPGVGTALGFLAGQTVSKTKHFTAIAKLAAMAKKVKQAKAFQHVAASTKARAAASNMIKFGKELAPVSIANSLEEVIIHSIEKEKGYSYDLAPAVAMGAFAPAVFKTLGMAIKPGFRAIKSFADTYGITKKITPENIKELDAKVDDPVSGPLMKKISDEFGDEAHEEIVDALVGMYKTGYDPDVSKLLDRVSTPEKFDTSLKEFKVANPDVKPTLSDIIGGDLDLHLDKVKSNDLPEVRDTRLNSEDANPSTPKEYFRAVDTSKITGEVDTFAKISDDFEDSFNKFRECVSGIVSDV